MSRFSPVPSSGVALFWTSKTKGLELKTKTVSRPIFKGGQDMGEAEGDTATWIQERVGCCTY